MKIKFKYVEANENSETIDIHNDISLYVLGIKIKTIRLGREMHSSKGKDEKVNTAYMILNQLKEIYNQREIFDEFNKLIKTIKFKKLYISLGINLDDPINNAYIIALINSLISLVLAKNSKNINLKETGYETFISQKTIYFKVDSIVSLPLVKNIFILIRIIKFFIKMKGGKKNGYKTSNRIINDNINDINREYDRC